MGPTQRRLHTNTFTRPVVLKFTDTGSIGRSALPLPDTTSPVLFPTLAGQAQDPHNCCWRHFLNFLPPCSADLASDCVLHILSNSFEGIPTAIGVHANLITCPITGVKYVLVAFVRQRTNHPGRQQRAMPVIIINVAFVILLSKILLPVL